MQITMVISRDFPRKKKHKALEVADSILSGKALGGVVPTELMLADTPDSLNHLIGFSAVNRYGIQVYVVTIDPPAKSRIRITQTNRAAPDVKYIQYPHPHPLPRQAKLHVWRAIFGNRDEWMIQQAFKENGEGMRGNAIFLYKGKDSEVAQADYYAANFGVHIGREIKPARNLGLVYSFNIAEIIEAESPKQLTLF